MELDPRLYTVAWIAPLEIEARAAAYMLDREHIGRFPMQRGDDYVYQAGEICGHNVVIATLPAGQEYATGFGGRWRKPWRLHCSWVVVLKALVSDEQPHRVHRSPAPVGSAGSA
ncbi:hypothetical protein MY11210_009527 [Beauveria gryllotalpidicola]